ncbi:MAG: hypothetical protein K2F97_03455 [Muribaculaceae bacterium]|nr:hypothetical protein [Muribaculaceae bacterium]MDE6486121.1 hypothetical protein [Muribaculaceae bacterium]
MLTTLPDNKNWRGYNLRELRYRRARVAADLQAQRIMLSRRTEALRRSNPVTRSWNSMRDLFSIIGYANSAVLAFQLVRRLRSLWRSFRH